MKQQRRTYRTAQGFTLIELMIAMTTGMFVVGAAYYISRTSGRMFSEQLRRAETQMTVRSAVELLRRDIVRAGFASARGTNELPSCNNTLGDIGNGMLDVSPTAISAVRVTLDAARRPILTITGNLTSADTYFVDNATSTPTGISLIATQEPYRRSFADTAGNFVDRRFLAAFVPDPDDLSVRGRMLSFQDLQTRRLFLRDIAGITLVAGVPPVIQLAQPLPIPPNNVGCTLGPWVAAPVSAVQYTVERPGADPELALSAGTTWMTGGTETNAVDPDRWLLVRRELVVNTVNNAAPTAIRGSARIVLDYLEPGAFRIEAIWDRAWPVGPPDLQRSATPEVLNPTTIRSLIIELMVRSNERAALQQAEDLQRALAARRFARFEVFLPNAARNPGTLP